MSGRINHDPIEDNPTVKAFIIKAEKEAEKSIKNIKKGQRGYCHVFWGVKARILQEKYGIKWQSPAELNPSIRFD